MKFNHKHHKKKNEVFVGHFRLLGLKRGECRANVIRSAAQAMSVAISHNGNAADRVEHSVDDVQRAKIALAAYRLLDPRERSDVYERIQLCYPIDREDANSATPSVGKLVDQMVPIPVKARRPITTIVKLMGQPVIEEAIGGNSPADEDPEPARLPQSREPAGCDPTLEERRSIARLVREFDDATQPSLSPIGWLRSRLGL